MSARDEPMYLATARGAVRNKERVSHVVARELVARIDRDTLALKAAQPRTITTAEELDKLPVGSVILGGGKIPRIKSEDGHWLGDGIDVDGEHIIRYTDFAVVLHDPEAKA